MAVTWLKKKFRHLALLMWSARWARPLGMESCEFSFFCGVRQSGDPIFFCFA